MDERNDTNRVAFHESMTSDLFLIPQKTLLMTSMEPYHYSIGEEQTTGMTHSLSLWGSKGRRIFQLKGRKFIRRKWPELFQPMRTSIRKSPKQFQHKQIN